ncbi:MAG TPA: hypothetical protein VNM37_01550 [Candidatus Dormibacteraeota bacterium]|nr:hypothetical protein [Candidatus Dormibacteraeota bacterium]
MAEEIAPEKTDPTLLTTAALQREIAALKSQGQDALAAEVRVIVTRIEEIQRAIDKASEDYVRVPTLLDRAVTQLQQLMDRRFERIDAELKAAEKLRDEKFGLVQSRLDELEKAANKQAENFTSASAKSEANFVKQVDQLVVLVQTSTKGLDDKITSGTEALDDKITDAKERLTRIESTAVGRIENKAETHTSSTFAVSIIGLLIAVVSIGIAIFLRTH